MSINPSDPGRISWIDLTVPNAASLRDFYTSVVGWSSTTFDIGEHQDFCVHAPGDEKPVAGICHAANDNAALPPVWLIYVNVADLDASLKRVIELGGAILDGPRGMGPMGRFAAIRDPAGAALALFEPRKS